MAARVHKNLRYHPDNLAKPVMPNEVMAWEATMAGFAILTAIAFVGVVAAVTWVGFVSLGIHRDDHSGAISAPAALSRVSRIARQATGVRGFGA
jgi:hypothetical protein